MTGGLLEFGKKRWSVLNLMLLNRIQCIGGKSAQTSDKRKAEKPIH